MRTITQRLKMNKMSKSKRRPIHGVGINDSDYITHTVVDGKKTQCPYYKKWAAMIERCYSKKLHTRHPTYKDCSVCDEWLLFSNFKSWMIKQDWEGKHLDKDIIEYGNTTYSPETCCFVPSNINTLILKERHSSKILPTGVSLHKSGKYTSNIRINGELKYLGLYDTVDMAKAVYNNEKEKAIRLAISEITDQRVINGLYKYLSML